jgi:hypothetical protein
VKVGQLNLARAACLVNRGRLPVEFLHFSGGAGVVRVLWGVENREPVNRAFLPVGKGEPIL